MPTIKELTDQAGAFANEVYQKHMLSPSLDWERRYAAIIQQIEAYLEKDPQNAAAKQAVTTYFVIYKEFIKGSLSEATFRVPSDQTIEVAIEIARTAPYATVKQDLQKLADRLKIEARRLRLIPNQNWETQAKALDEKALRLEQTANTSIQTHQKQFFAQVSDTVVREAALAGLAKVDNPVWMQPLLPLAVGLFGVAGVLYLRRKKHG